MSLHAIDDIDDAIDATTSFLRPFAARTWLKLMVVLFFLGGTGTGGLNQVDPNPTSGGSGTPQTGGDPTMPSAPIQSVADIDPLVLAGIGVAVVLVVLYGLLSNFMEFVLAESLIEREVRLRESLRANLGNGLRLLGFRLTVTVLSLVGVAAVVYTVFVFGLGVAITDITPDTVLRAIPLLVGPLLLGALVVSLLKGFTNVFVVPLMVTREAGLLDCWGRLWASITDRPKQYLGYVGFSVVIGFGVGLFVGIVITILALVLGIPTIFVVVAIGAGIDGLAAAVVIALVVAALLAVVVPVALFLQVPFQTYLRYYAMLVLGDIDDSLDPIPEVRADIRPDDDGAATPAEG